MEDNDKIRRVDNALRVERDLLRGRLPIGYTGTVPKSDLPLANHINNFIHAATGETKIRLYDLIANASYSDVCIMVEAEAMERNS